MKTHSMFSQSKDPKQKNTEEKEEIIQKMLMNTMNNIHKDMEKEKESLINGGMPANKAANFIANKQEKLQLEALENFKIVYHARYGATSPSV